MSERMVGALSVVGSSVMDSHTGPCLCVDALPTTSVNLKSGGDVLYKNLMGRKHNLVKHGGGTMKLSSSFVDPGREWGEFLKWPRREVPYCVGIAGRASCVRSWNLGSFPLGGCLRLHRC